MRKMKDSGIEWIGEIPTNWYCIRGKYILAYMKKPVRKDDEVITCFRNGEVTLRSNRREEGFTLSNKEIGYQGIDVGDLVVHGMDGFAGSIGISDSRGKASPVLNVLDSEQDKRYIMYYIRNMAYSNVFLNLSTGIRVRSCDLRWSKLAELRYPVPPLKIQEKISQRLEKICENSNVLVDVIQSQIDILEQYKQSVITEVVTKGLNTNVELKDSGIEWVEAIPVHWNVHPVYHYFAERKKRNIRGKENNLLSLSYGRVIRKDINLNGGLLPENFNTYNIVENGDIIIRPTDLQNDKRSLRTGLVKEHGIITSAYIDLMPIRHLDTRYFHYLLHSYDVMKVFYNMGNGVRQGLNFPEFSRLMIFEPSYQEQVLIADYLDDKVEKIDALIDAKKQQIIVMETYKKTNIYEYVTGKREVK